MAEVVSYATNSTLTSGMISSGYDGFTWLLIFKALAAVGSGIVCFIGALIPTRLVKLLKGKGDVLSYANCLGAGILLGASFVHLLTDSEDEDDNPLIESFPFFPHMIAGIGFLLSFALEKVIFGHGHSHAHLPDSDTHHHHHHDASHGDGHHHNHDKDLDDLEVGIELDGMGPDKEEEGHGHSHGEAEETAEEEAEEDHGHGHGHGHGQTAAEGPKRFPYILFVILGIESLVSGSALGVQETAWSVLVLFLAIVTHIWAESFTLCVGVFKSGLPESKTLMIMAAYSTLTPIGIAFGIITQLMLSTYVAGIVSALLVAFAAGSFLYVATLEIIVEEFEAEKGRLVKLALVLLGYAFMCVLVLFF